MTDFERVLSDRKIPRELIKLVSYVMRTYGMFLIGHEKLNDFFLRPSPRKKPHIWWLAVDIMYWKHLEICGAGCWEFWNALSDLLYSIFDDPSISLESRTSEFKDICKCYDYKALFEDAKLDI